MELKKVSEFRGKYVISQQKRELNEINQKEILVVEDLLFKFFKWDECKGLGIQYLFGMYEVMDLIFSIKGKWR